MRPLRDQLFSDRHDGRRVIILGCAASAWVVAMLGGCIESRGFHDREGTMVESDCVFDAVDVRIHPLSRIVRRSPSGDSEQQPTLDAHIEFVDAWGHTAKSLGVLRLELGRSGLRQGDQLGAVRWEIDLRDPSTNSGRFDRVTQTYLLTLDDLPAWVSSNSNALLRVTFVRADGITLESSEPIAISQE